MNIIWLMAASAALLLAIGFLTKTMRHRRKKKWNNPYGSFDDAVRSAELTNIACFRSLDLMLGNLEAVRTRVARAEQRLRSIVARPALASNGRFGSGARGVSRKQRAAKGGGLANPPLGEVKLARRPRVRRAGTSIEARTRKQRPEKRSTTLLKKNGRLTQTQEGIAGDAGDLFSRESKNPRLNGIA